MEITKALEILKLHNEWRRDKEIPSTTKMQSPADIGAAIDTVIESQSELLRQNQEMREALKETKEALEWYMENTTPGIGMTQTFHDLGMNLINKLDCLTSLDKGK